MAFAILMVGSAAAQQTPLPSAPSSSKQPDSASKPRKTEKKEDRNLLKRLARDQIAIWTIPVRLRTQDLQWALPLAGLTGASLAYDPEIAREVVRSGSHAHTARRVSDASVLAIGALAVAQYGLGHHRDDSHLRESGTLALEAMVNSVIVSETLSFALGRERPLEGSGRGQFFSGGQSFPSSHSAAAWAGASVIAHEYPGWLTQTTVYSLAAATSIARVAGQKHWPSDVLVGAATGYLSGREIYRLHHADTLDSAIWGTFQSKEDRGDDSESVVGNTYVPLDSWVYPLFDRLAALGYIGSQGTNVRPWTRAECYRLLREAEDNIETDSEGSASGIVSVLKKEFENEGTLTGGTRAEAALESVYTRAMVIAGPDLRESYHYGETVINDYGRPYGRGGNLYTGFSGRAIGGRFSLYVRGEYQHGAASPTLPLAARQFISTSDPVTPVPDGRFPSTDRLTLLETYVGVAGAGWELTAGKQSLWWGPGRSGPFLFSNNSEPIYMLRATRPESFRLPGPFAALGRWNLDVFFGEVTGHHYPARTLIHGEKLSWKPTNDLEFGFSRTTFFGGEGFQPLTWKTFYNSYFSVGDNLYGNFTKTDPGDRRGAFDFTLRVPGLRDWLTIYSDAFVDDDLSPLSAPHKAAFSPGIYLPKLPKLHNFEFRAEAPYTDVPNYNNIPFGAFMYWNQNYRDGYTNRGKIIGNWVGRRTNGYQAWLTYWASPMNKVELSYRGLKDSSYYIPGGGTQQDYSVSSVWRVKPNVEVSGKVQYESWLLPIIDPNRQRDWSGSFQVTWYPAKVLRKGAAR